MYYAAPQQNWTRLVSISAVIALNALVIFGLLAGLGRQTIEQGVDPIVTEVIEEAPPLPQQPPAPPVPELAPPELPKIPPVEIPIEELPPPPPPVQTITRVESGAPAAAPAPLVVPPRLRRLDIRPDYPEASRRFKEEGETLTEICVGVDGRAYRVTLERSSGSERLDQAAVIWLQRQSYIPGSVSGQLQPTCIKFTVEWNLPD